MGSNVCLIILGGEIILRHQPDGFIGGIDRVLAKRLKTGDQDCAAVCLVILIHNIIRRMDICP